MIGAIIGDIVGSRFEYHNIKTKDFEFFSPKCSFTDDTIMSLAIADALLFCKGDYNVLPSLCVNSMRRLGKLYPDGDYGGSFRRWLKSDNPQPYNSFGNGAAMRISACAFVANSVEEAKHLSYNSTYITHNHYEGIKGAESTAVAVFLARTGVEKSAIRRIISDYYYPMNFSLDEIRSKYRYDVTCQGTVPQALEAFFEANSFEDAIRNAISIGGDSDTLAAITGAVAEAYFGVPSYIRDEAVQFLDKELFSILTSFELRYPSV